MEASDLAGFWRWRDDYLGELRPDGVFIQHREYNFSMKFGTWEATPEGFDFEIPGVYCHQVSLEDCNTGQCVRDGTASDIRRTTRRHPVDDEGFVNANSFHPSEDVFVMQTDNVAEWHLRCRPSTPYTLITTHSDSSITQRFRAILEDPRLMAWYAANARTTHPKLNPIPLGVRHVVNVRDGMNLHGYHENMRKAASSTKDKLFHVSFLTMTNRDQRKRCLRATGMSSRSLDLSSYLSDMGRSMYCLSPEGTGMDCHRTWEALYCRTIPIITHNPMVNMGLYDGLPVIVLPQWEDFRANEFTAERYVSMMEGFDPASLTIERWIR